MHQHQKTPNISLSTHAQDEEPLYAHFGALLGKLRREANTTQADVAGYMIEYAQKSVLRGLGITIPDHLEPQELRAKAGKTVQKNKDRIRVAYARIERNTCPPKFRLLLPLYIALTAGCGCGATITDKEKRLYITLAQQEIEAKTAQYHQNVTENDWAWLKAQIATADGVPFPGSPRLALVERAHNTENEKKAEHNDDPANHATSYDVSHIVGRDTFIATQLDLLENLVGKPRIKVSTIYGLTGTGKTTCLKLLQEKIEKRAIFHLQFDVLAKNKTPVDHLHDFLANLLLRFDVLPLETGKPPSVSTRIQQAMEAIQHTHLPLVLIIDDFQIALDNGEVGSEWQLFFQEFVEQTHTATMYLASRVCPRWGLRNRSFFTEVELPPLPTPIAVQIWRNLGFVEEEESLLLDAAKKCGGNPGYMNIVSLHAQKPVVTFDWTTSFEDEGEESGLQRFVRDPYYLSNQDLAFHAFPLLEEILATRISPESRELLNVLAVASVPLASPLLRHVCQIPGPLYQELLQASLLASNRQRIHLLPFVAESVRQQLSKERIFCLEEKIVDLYNRWLGQGDFRDDSEQTALVTDLILLHLQHHRLLDAAHLLLQHGWRCLSFGYAGRIARIASSVMKQFPWQDDKNNNAGGILILYQIGKRTGLQARAQDYEDIYSQARSGTLVLSENVQIHLAHHIMQYHIEQHQFENAQKICDEALSIPSVPQESDIESVALAIYTKAHFLGSWSDYKETHAEKEESRDLNREAVTTLEQGIHILRQYKQNASSLKKRNIDFKLARFLHSHGYRQRLLGDLEKAEKALIECIQLKKTGSAVRSSFAVSLGEYAQLLAAKGKFSEALESNSQALEIVEELLGSGDQSDQVLGDKGMHLVERGLILLQQAKLFEAKRCFEESLLYTQKARRLYFDRAEEKLQMILALETKIRTSHYHLDEQWFNRYTSLTNIDEIKALTPAGPFSSQQEVEWASLAERQDQEAITLRSKILVETLQNELALARQQRREPDLWYPMIPKGDVAQRKRSLVQLRTLIEEHEENARVRQLYQEAIHNDLVRLAQIEAVDTNNMQAFWESDLLLYPRVKKEQMDYALRLFVPLINRGLRTEETHDQAKRLLKMLNRWQIRLEDIEPPKTIEKIEKKARNTSTAKIPPQMLKRYMEEVLKIYGFDDCKVQIEPTRDEAYVQASLRTIYLANKDVSRMEGNELIGEELETHIYRSEAGYKSPLKLLGIGLAGYQATEEGLAYHYIEQIAQAHQRKRSFSWIGTLAVGLASGAISVPVSFRELSDFLDLAFSIRNILSGSYETIEQAQAAARQESDMRTVRTYRGVKNLSDPNSRGICSNRGNLYLDGYQQVAQKLKEGLSIERLFVGKISIDHLPIMDDLGIIAPAISHRHIALQPEINAWFDSFDDD